MTPSRPTRTLRPRWLPVLLLLALLAPNLGCSGGRARRLSAPPMLGALRPPNLIGSRIRSQDSSSLVGRLRRRALPSSPQNSAPAPASTPNVQWSEPGTLASRPSVKPVRPVHVTLPAAPTLPTNTPKIARASTASPAPAPKPKTSDIAQIRALITSAQTRLKAIRNYQVTMKRQERVGDTLQPAEEVILSLRHSPRAVRLEWPSGPSQGREVIYSEQETAGQLQIYAPGTLVPRLSLAPDSPLVLSKSRHPITEAGLEDVLLKLDRSLKPHETAQAPPASKMTYDGLVARPELPQPCHQITEIRANGETWIVALDPQTSLPVLVDGRSPSGDLLEHYVFLDLHTDLPALAAADAFDPGTRWKSTGTGGLLGRLAGSPPPASSGVR